MFYSKAILAANESAATEEAFVGWQLFANEYNASQKLNLVQLSPFGRFPNAVGLQIFNKGDADAIANEFHSAPSMGVKALGLPWYVGHPDHPAFKEQYKDTKAYGRIKDLQVRHDPNCTACEDFANQESATPCKDHGLFGCVKWSDDGKDLIANQSYHGHSTNWRMKKNGAGEWHPFSLKSVGFTNEPNIPVPAITAANSMANKKNSLMGYVSTLLKKPELAQEGANEDDAVMGMNEFVAGAQKTAADLAAEKEAHGKLQATHSNLVNTMAGLTKCYGANEAVEPVVAKLKADCAVEVPAEGQVVFMANEIVVRTATIKTKDTELQAANEKVTSLTTLAANQRKETAKNLGHMLLVGGFVTKAELEAMTKEKDFANEAQYTAFMAAGLALKPKINVVSQVGALGHVSANVSEAVNQQTARIDTITEAVNEEQDKLAAKHPKRNRREFYNQAHANVVKKRPELFKAADDTIVR
jgi:hypothetical protein